MNEFNKDLDKNIAKLERLSSSADKATSSIDKLSEAYNKLQELANEPVNFKIKGSPRRGGGSKSGGAKSGDADKDKSSKKKEDSKFTKASKKIKQGTEFFNVITDFGSSLKSGKLSSTAAAASKGLGLMGGALGTAAIAVGGVTAALAVLSKVTLDANRKTTSYAQSLRAMGVELSEFDKQNLETSKQMRDLGNRFDNVTQAIGEGLYPVLGGLLDLLDLITGGISSAESKDKIAGAQASISTSAQQSGFSLSSSNNLAGNTYKAAQQIADKTSEQASDVAKKLADAWLNGSDAAKEYGVVVNDQVLTGYMASQGVDIANVEITDAMKQYYRYQLMMEQLSSSNRDAMQDMIKEWTQLGFIIDKTKGKLFSFDEVIQLTAADPTIPEVGGSGLVYPDDSDYDTDAGIPGPNPGNSSSNNNEAVKANTAAVAANSAAVVANTNATAANTNALNANTEALRQVNIGANPDSSQITIAAQLMNLAAEKFSVAANGMYSAAVAAASQISQVINASAQSAAAVIQASTAQGVGIISSVANQQTSKIINISEFMMQGIAQQTEMGKMAVGQTTTFGVNQVKGYTIRGVNQVNSAGKSNVINVNFAGKTNVGNVNNAGKSNVTKINSVGNSWVVKLQNLAANLASRFGARYGRSSTSSKSSKGGSKGSSGKRSSGKRSGSFLGGLNGYDAITETADLFTSLKDDENVYHWDQLPGATLDMAASSVLNPIGAIKTGYKLGSEYNGFTGGISGAIVNLGEYFLLESFGDLVNLAEFVQDHAAIAWDKITGGNAASLDSPLTDFSNAIDSTLNDMVNGTGNFAKFADGGIGTKEIHNATLFEGNKKEAVIPLETDAGIRYLSDAMIQAQGVAGQGLGGDIIINLTLSGVNIADNDAQWEKVGRKIAEVIEVQRQRRGELNYGSTF